MLSHRLTAGRGLAALVVTTLAMVACGGTSGGGSSTNAQVTIGASGALTGSAASFGLEAKDVYTMVVDQWNAKGGLLGHPVNLDNEDSKGDPGVAATVAQKFVDHNVTAVVGDVLSTACLSQGPVYNRANMPWMIALCSNPTLTSHGWNNTFRAIFRDDQAGGFAGDYSYKTLGAKTAVVINDTSAYAQGSGSAFVKSFTADGGRVLSVEQITPGNKDYTATMTKVKNENPDVVHFTGFYTEGAILVNEARALGITSKLLWGAATPDPSFNQIAGKNAVGVLVVGSPTPQELPSSATFVSEFKAKYGREPGEFDEFDYDAIEGLLTAIKNAGSTDHAKIISALRNLSFQGASGLVKFDSNGDRTEVPFNVSVYDSNLTLKPYTP